MEVLERVEEKKRLFKILENVNHVHSELRENNLPCS